MPSAYEIADAMKYATAVGGFNFICAMPQISLKYPMIYDRIGLTNKNLTRRVI